MESLPGSLTGVLPYSRLKRPQWDVLAEEDTEILTISKDRFPEMIRDSVGCEIPVASARPRWLRPAATRARSINAPTLGVIMSTPH